MDDAATAVLDDLGDLPSLGLAVLRADRTRSGSHGRVQPGEHAADDEEVVARVVSSAWTSASASAFQLVSWPLLALISARRARAAVHDGKGPAGIDRLGTHYQRADGGIECRVLRLEQPGLCVKGSETQASARANLGEATAHVEGLLSADAASAITGPLSAPGAKLVINLPVLIS